MRIAKSRDCSFCPNILINLFKTSCSSYLNDPHTLLIDKMDVLACFYDSQGMVMVFNATFSNISVILCRSVLLVEETGVPREDHRPAVSHRQSLSHNVASSSPRHDLDSNAQRSW